MSRRYFQEFVLGNVFERTLQAHLKRRRKLNAFPIPLTAHIREMLRFTRVNGQIVRSSVLAYDHPLVHLFLWSNKKSASFLDVIQSVGRRSAAFHCHQDTVCPASDLAFECPIFLEKMAH